MTQRPDMVTVTIVKGDDWKGVYFDGALFAQGHSLDPVRDILKPLWGQRIGHSESRWVDSDWLECEGNLPERLSDIPETAWEA